jgi:hypothetical protein
MTADTESFRSPYTPYPGSSTPPAHVGPRQGKAELWTFFWLAFVNTLIIAVSGILAWWLVH